MPLASYTDITIKRLEDMYNKAYWQWMVYIQLKSQMMVKVLTNPYTFVKYFIFQCFYNVMVTEYIFVYAKSNPF